MTAKQKFDVETLKKHHFWIVTGAAALLGLAGAVWAIIELGGKTDFELAEREKNLKNATAFSAGEAQPNDKFPPFAQQKHKELAKIVLAAWERRYEQQKEFVDGRWPSWLQRYQAEIEKGIREGKEIPFHVRNAYRDNKLVTFEFESLFVDATGKRWIRESVVVQAPSSEPADKTEKAGAGRPISGRQNDPMAGAGAAGRQPPGGGAADRQPPGGPGDQQDDMGGAGSSLEWSGLVDWDASERDRLRVRLALYGKIPVPTSAEMRYCQESLNVYRVLLTFVIHETNKSEGKPITEHRHLAIKRIAQFLLGEEVSAAGSTTAATFQDESGAQQGFGAAGGDRQPPGAAGASGGNTAAFGAAAGAAAPGLGDSSFSGQHSAASPDGRNRYVDEKGQRIEDPSKQPFVEFRLLPVEFRLVIDQRHINDFLVNCANCPLPIEVQQVNIRSLDSVAGDASAGGAEGDNPFGAGAGAAAPGVPGAAGAGARVPPGGGGAGLGAPGLGGAGAGARVPPGGAGGEAAIQDQGRQPPGEGGGGNVPGGGLSEESPAVELGPYDVELQVRGIIYLFNPPDVTRLGIASAAELPAGPAAPAGAAPANGGAANAAAPAQGAPGGAAPAAPGNNAPPSGPPSGAPSGGGAAAPKAPG